MRKYIHYVVVVFSFLFFLSSCTFDIRNFIPGNWNPYKGDRPSDQVPSRWVAQEINCWFDVISVTIDGEVETAIQGEIEYNSVIVPITVRFDPGRNIFVYDASGEKGLLFRGPCTFGEDQFVVDVNKESDSLFDGHIQMITFIKDVLE